jgi:hypothetical protein
MNNNPKAAYLLAAGIGAMLGGLAVLGATRAIPKLLEQMMASMMANMAGRVGVEGCDPGEM